jgi:hypothetical protein
MRNASGGGSLRKVWMICKAYGAAAGQPNDLARPDLSGYMGIRGSLCNDVRLVGLDEHCHFLESKYVSATMRGTMS